MRFMITLNVKILRKNYEIAIIPQNLPTFLNQKFRRPKWKPLAFEALWTFKEQYLLKAPGFL